MTLAGFLSKYKGELRADFQEFYGLNLDGVGKTYSVSHAADLAVMLPPKSRTFCACNPANAWGDTERMLAGVIYRIDLLLWFFSKDGAKGRNRPKPITPPGQVQTRSGSEEVTMGLDEYKKVMKSIHGR